MKKIFILATFALGLNLLTPAGAALACTPPPGGLPAYTIADHVAAAPIVVEGVVVAVGEQNGLSTADIQVAQYIKGNGPAFLTADRYGPSSLCLSPVSPGEYGLFYLSVGPDGLYHAFYLSQFDAIQAADPQSIADAVAAAGGQPVPVASADAILFHLTEIAQTQMAEFSLSETAAVSGGLPGAPTPTPTPTPFAPPVQAESVSAAFTEVYATVNAASILYATDPAAASAILTQTGPTLEALYQITSTPTPACAPAFTAADQTDAADVVFEGVVTYSDTSSPTQSVVIQVVQYYKVNTTPQLSVQLNLDPTQACSFRLAPGDHYIFFAIGQPELVMFAIDPNHYHLVANPTDSNAVAQITAASGGSPVVMQDINAIYLMLTATAPFVPTQAPYPTFPPPYYPTFTTPPSAAPTTLEVMGLVAVGSVVGLIVGGLGGILIGLYIGRWRE